ncbi:RNA polymerase sigma-70 factor [bacterium]|nr:RNA polymerase sigma-70 factor [bacterium]
MASEILPEFIQRIRASDRLAFKEFFDLYEESIYNFICYKIGDSEAAEDILQDTFINLWETRHQLKDGLSLKSYVYTIANNLCLNFIRHRKVVLKYTAQDEEAFTSESPQSLLETKEYRQAVFNCIAALPEHPRTVFMLSRIDDLSYKEITERLSISIKTVESHIGKALKLLRACLQPFLKK